MGFIRKLFGGGNSVPERKPYTISVLPGESAPSVRVPLDAKPGEIINLLDLKPGPSIFITGGAGQMSDEDKRLTREMFLHGIAPTAEKYGITVIDGATKAGVIEMMAMARRNNGYTFPLIGIAPYARVTYPGHPDPSETEAYPLCEGHSHFVLVSGDEYGDESETIVYLTHALAGGVRDDPKRSAPSIGIVINGGSITRQEAYMATTKHLSMPLIVLEGSGRFADALATAKRTGETSQSLLRSIISRGDIRLVATTAGPKGMRDALETFFGA